MVVDFVGRYTEGIVVAAAAAAAAFVEAVAVGAVVPVACIETNSWRLCYL